LSKVQMMLQNGWLLYW